MSLGNVDNYATASQAEAEAGTANDKFMTALRTAQAITALQAFKSAGTGITCALGVCGADFSIILQYENSGGTPASPVESGKRIATDTTNHRPYWALNDAWARIMRYDEGALASHAHAASDVTSGTLAVAQGGTGLSSGTSGGVLAYTASGTLASSGALTANLPVIGGGAGAAPTVGTRSGNTTEFGTTTGAKTTGKQLQFDASGNIEASSSDVGSGSSTDWVAQTGHFSTTAVGAGLTRYVALPGGAWGSSETTGQYSYVISKTGTLKNFRIRTAAAAGADGNCVLTLRINGADTAASITVTAGAAAGHFSNTSDTVSVTAGDWFSFKAVDAGGSDAGPVFAGFAFVIE